MSLFIFKFVLTWLRRHAAGATARAEGAALVFGAGGVKVIFGIGAAVALGFFLLLADGGEPAWMWSVPLLFLIVFLCAWPADIVLDAHGLARRPLWGCGRRMPWSDVAAALHRQGDGSTFVVSYSGAEIRHTGYHADPARFQAEVKARASLDRIGDWDAVPSLLPSRP